MARYPFMQPTQFTVLPFGAPEADFDLLTSQRVEQDVFNPTDGKQHWVYVGRTGDDMYLALGSFFSALRDARQKKPENYAQLRLHFIGTDYALGQRARKTVEPVAQAYGLADLVEERPHRIPYFEALQCLLDADALIVPGSDDPGYTASKLYPYILAHKPLVAVFHEQSSVVSILHDTQAGVIVPFATGEAPEAVGRRVERAWFDPQAWRVKPSTNWDAVAPYTAREMARRQCKVFDKVVAGE